MPRFIARPVIIEAHQFDKGTIGQWPDSFRLAVRRRMPDGTVEIMTGDGARNCKHRDWVWRGPDGEFSVSREAAFEAMFDEHVPAAEPDRRVTARKERTNA